MADEKNPEETEENTEVEEPTEEQDADSEVKDSHGQPGINKERHDREVKQLNDKISQLQAKLDEAAETKAGRDELSEKIAKLQGELETERATSKLEKAGCIDTETALLLLSRYDNDPDKLKEAKPFLFEKEKKGTTGANPTGAADDAKTRQAKADAALGIKGSKK